MMTLRKVIIIDQPFPKLIVLCFSKGFVSSV